MSQKWINGLLAIMGLFYSHTAHAETLRIACVALGKEFTVCKEGVDAWAAQTGHTVELISPPNSSNEMLALYQQLLAAQDDGIDIFQIDVVWPGILATHFIDLNPHFDDKALKAHFPAIIRNNTVKKQLVAMPWYTDAGLLYYRKDLLKKHGYSAPTTWEELSTIAKDVQTKERAADNDRFWGFVWQGRAYEGLTCNAMEWLDSFGAGTVVDIEGNITIPNPQAIKALDTAASWINTISPKGILNYAEEEARGVFQSGNALFMRNWPYAWNLTQSEDSPVKGKVGTIPLPKGGENGKHTGTLGGWQLAISKYSTKQELALDLVRYLTSAKEQKRRAIVGGYAPTIASLYDDKEILNAIPLFGVMKETFANAVARPSSQTGRKYNQVSSGLWNATHATLSGSGDAEENLTSLKRRLERVSRGGQW